MKKEGGIYQERKETGLNASAVFPPVDGKMREGGGRRERGRDWTLTMLSASADLTPRSGGIHPCVRKEDGERGERQSAALEEGKGKERKWRQKRWKGGGEASEKEKKVVRPFLSHIRRRRRFE